MYPGGYVIQMIRDSLIETIKRDLYNHWTVLKRGPLLVLFASSLVGGMVLIVWVLSSIIRLILG